MEDNKKRNYPGDFEPVDVSEPREVRRERDIIAQERAEYRKMLLKRYRVYIFLVLGVLIVALIIFGVKMYNDSTNPWARLIKASAKNFDAPFSFEMSLSKDGKDVMKYNGAADINRSSQKVKIYYDAKYSDYVYSSATIADGKMYAGGSLYDGKWRVRDCEEKIHDFFDFDTDYRKGKFDAGAFLRFTEMNTAYSSVELQEFIESLFGKLSASGTLAEVGTEKTDGGMSYSYDFDLSEIFELIVNEGASVFYRSDDYYDFKARYEANSDVIKAAKCRLTYTINNDGYLSSLALEAEADGQKYSMKLGFSGFGTTQAELPEEFLAEAAKLYEE